MANSDQIYAAMTDLRRDLGKTADKLAESREEMAALPGKMHKAINGQIKNHADGCPARSSQTDDSPKRGVLQRLGLSVRDTVTIIFVVLVVLGSLVRGERQGATVERAGYVIEALMGIEPSASNEVETE